jgi:hypothetical protein
LQRVQNGQVSPIPHSEYFAWKVLTKTRLSIRDYPILRAMDAAYVAEVAKELSAFEARRKEAMDLEAAKASGKGKRRGR